MEDHGTKVLSMEASPETTNAPGQHLRLPLLKGVCMHQVRRIVGLIASYAVSYTHLDVYKRQINSIRK